MLIFKALFQLPSAVDQTSSPKILGISPELIVAIVSAMVGLAGLLWGIYKHKSSQKESVLEYEVSQLSDYKVPAKFLESMSGAPLAIIIESSGTKSAEHVELRLFTKSTITGKEFSPSDLAVECTDSELKLSLPRLNPGQSVTIHLQCAGSPHESQVGSFELTQAEGRVIDKRTVSMRRGNFLDLFASALRSSLYVRIPRPK